MHTCILCNSLSEWQRLADKLQELPLPAGMCAPLNDFLFWGAELETDKNGRAVLPAHLREYAGIDKEL